MCQAYPNKQNCLNKIPMTFFVTLCENVVLLTAKKFSESISVPS
jgi:hypothetical protein